MKLQNAINRINKELGIEVSIIKVNKIYTIGKAEFKGFDLTFTVNNSNDAENFYTVKQGAENGYNGSQGTDHSNLSQALQYLKIY